MKKQQSFFEQCETIKSEVVENLIKKMERQHQWRRLAELVKYREELKGCKNGQENIMGCVK
ncbi:MAG: hypothetical protein Q8N63_00490 [Nanoarchaeota archaeon]|nr:hypothetical protein [Nanoarchaeota archaeon]